MMSNKKLKTIEVLVFGFILYITLMAFCNEAVDVKLNKCFLPEERNRGFYEILNNEKEYFISDEMMENGTENLLANYLKSGDRKEGYSINVNSDGTFSISGSYNGEKNKYESILPIGVGFDLETGDYILSDGGASTTDGISLKLTGAKHMIGGETKYFTLANLPGNGSFHWDRDPNIELYAEIVIRPGASVTELKFSPMLIKAVDAADQENGNNEAFINEYMPCWTPNYDWEKEEDTEDSICYRYGVYKGALDGVIVTKDDWKIFTNSIRYQMQAERAVIDFQDGTGIEVYKNDFPLVKYGKINASNTIRDGREIKLTDYQMLVDSIKSDANISSGAELYTIRDIYEYLKVLDHGNYTILISVKDDGVKSLDYGTFRLLQKLGVTSGLMDSESESINKKKNYRNSFLCVLRHGDAQVEKLGEQKLMSEGKLSDGISYSIESCGKKTDDPSASILINGVEYAMNMRGMNIVIYDDGEHEVVDSVCFDTSSGLRCHRQPEGY